MKKDFIYITLFLFLPLTLLGQNTAWKINKYKVKFTIKNTGIKVDGSLSGLDMILNFDEQSTSNSFKASVKTNTIKTGIDARDNHLKKESYLNVEKFPLISIESNKITAIGNGKYLANCTIKMKGVSKSISIPFTYNYINNMGVFKSSFVLNRLDFKVGESSFVLADDVLVNIEFEAINTQ
jgi:polyisoprenoid-binding protein YceI